MNEIIGWSIVLWLVVLALAYWAYEQHKTGKRNQEQRAMYEALARWHETQEGGKGSQFAYIVRAWPDMTIYERKRIAFMIYRAVWRVKMHDLVDRIRARLQR